MPGWSAGVLRKPGAAAPADEPTGCCAAGRAGAAWVGCLRFAAVALAHLASRADADCAVVGWLVPLARGWTQRSGGPAPAGCPRPAWTLTAIRAKEMVSSKVSYVLICLHHQACDDTMSKRMPVF